MSANAREDAGEGIPELSVVAPAYDERDNLRPLYERVKEAFASGPSWELVLVDDGSRDDTPEVIRALSEEDPRVRGVFFAANRGQTTATAAGLRATTAPLIATLDADLQNDPADLHDMLAVIEGCDAVVGYRLKRQDSWVRRASSKVANAVRNRLTGESIRDTGCSLKLFRREAIFSIPLFEGMHRFLPTLLRYHGYRVEEVPVSHKPRVAGESKYGIRNRAWRATKDLFAVRWMRARVIRYELVDEVAGEPAERRQ
jgi:glycosyltransferase involved in cell wall biosynthesis